ncbi:MAG: DUF4298 domain-containing protein [Bacillota bacterium]|nr:DUF4298 domain-containing protein [Bacillota bacterium]
MIERIQQMENYYDTLHQWMQSEALELDETIEHKIRALMNYIESGDWLHDYEMDEKGYLPKTLKRGVLSQDGLYNLLSEICEIYNI